MTTIRDRWFRRSWSRIAVYVVSALGFLVAGLAWAVSSPPGGSPDESFHLASVWCPGGADTRCTITRFKPDGAPVVVVPQAVAESSGCWAANPEITAVCLDKFSLDVSEETSSLNNGLYPGGYYYFMHLFVSDNLTRSVWFMRGMNVLFTVGIFGALLWLLPGGSRRSLVYTAAAALVPQSIYFLASVNPTAWGILGVTTTWLGLHGAYVGETKARRFALAGIGVLGAIMAAVARSDSAAMTVVAMAAVVVFHWDETRRISQWRRHRVRLASCLIVVVVGAIGFFSGSQRGALEGFTAPLEGRNKSWILIHNIAYLPQLLTGVWQAPLGWLDTPLTPLTVTSAVVVAFGMIFWGIRRSGPAKNLALAGVGLMIIGLPLWVLQQGLYVVGEGMQPRYLAPLVIVFVGIALTNPDGTGSSRLSLTQTVVCYGLLVVAHSLALHSLMRRVVTGIDVDRFNLDIGVEWWPAGLPSPMATWALGSFAFALFLLVLFAVRSAEVAPDSEVGLPLGNKEISRESAENELPPRAIHEAGAVDTDDRITTAAAGILAARGQP